MLHDQMETKSEKFLVLQLMKCHLDPQAMEMCVNVCVSICVRECVNMSVCEAAHVWAYVCVYSSNSKILSWNSRVPWRFEHLSHLLWSLFEIWLEQQVWMTFQSVSHEEENDSALVSPKV